MKTFMITGPSSNTGKTSLSLGIARALKNRGLDISPFKTGPDFIDTKYLEIAAGKTAGNLDIHMMGIEGLKEAIAMNNGEYGIVEGAMGYFDGIHNTFENSSFHISEELDIPAILVYVPKGEMFSAIPKLKGIIDFSNHRIKGIIFNKTNKKIYDMLKEKVEEYLDIEVLGYVPQDESLEIGERYLGLLQVHENLDLDNKLDIISEKIEETVDIDRLLLLARDIEIQPFKYPRKRDITVGIAYDEAFNFYYQENLKLLEKTAELVYFSPLNHRKLPDVDLIYIGGGYPELYRDRLSSNRDMIESIRDFAKNGGRIYSEGGGFMYLVEDIEGVPMCGLIKGKAVMTNRLQRFGYIDIKLKMDCLLGTKGDIIKGQEFHRSIVETGEREIFKITKPKSNKNWECGYMIYNTLAGYPHINFLGNKKVFNHILDILEKSKRGE
ncbi:MAG: cobyrinate a,c-diamide synthase [Tissierellaceae bacterium]